MTSYIQTSSNCRMTISYISYRLLQDQMRGASWLRQMRASVLHRWSHALWKYCRFGTRQSLWIKWSSLIQPYMAEITAVMVTILRPSISSSSKTPLQLWQPWNWKGWVEYFQLFARSLDKDKFIEFLKALMKEQHPRECSFHVQHKNTP